MDARRTEQHRPEEYEPPEIIDYGNLVELTAHTGPGHPLGLPQHPLHPTHPHFSS